MSIIHVNQIKNQVNRLFSVLLDLSDIASHQGEMKDKGKKTGFKGYYMELTSKTTGLICSALMCVSVFVINTPADEIGVSIGLNTSAYKAPDKNRAEYQKTDFLSPIEVTFQKEFTKFIGLHSALQYTKRSNSEPILITQINPETSAIEFGGTVKYKEAINYLSLEISPIFTHRLKQISLDARFGVIGDLYINEWTNNFGNKSSIFRSKNTSPFVLGLVGGVGLGYIIHDRFEIGLRSSISRTLTDIYKNEAAGAELFYLNFHNVLFANILF